MKIGIFDSGLGGLFVLRNMLRNNLKYDFIFLGDTRNLPYGSKSQKRIYQQAIKGVEYLFKHDCALVIIACNTISSEALRKIQQEWLPKSKYKERKVLGVIRPTVELIKYGDVCVLATEATVRAKAYTRELRKINPRLKVYELAAPELVQLIESNQRDKLEKAIKKYTTVIRDRMTVKNLILGCTHFGLIKNEIKKSLPKTIKVISQEALLPAKLKSYLARHNEIERKLSKNSQMKLLITKANPLYPKLAKVVKI